ncbi:MAG: hypothetical protein AAFZ09_17655 [Pseudomonadota bacterium]
MLNAAMVLGILGGVCGMVVGFFGYGFTEAFALIEGMIGEDAPSITEELRPENVDTIRLVSLLAPIAGIAGGAMVLTQRLVGAILLAGSAAGMFHGFGFGVFTMFPIAMCALAALFALLGRREERA